MKKIILIILFLCANIGFSQFNFNFNIYNQSGTNIGTSGNIQYVDANSWYLYPKDIDLSATICEGDQINIKNFSSGSLSPSVGNYSLTPSTLWDVKNGYTFNPTGGTPNSWQVYPNGDIIDNQPWSGSSGINYTIPNSTGTGLYAYHTILIAPILNGHFAGVYNSYAGCQRVIALKLKVKKAPKCLSNLKVCDDSLLTNQILGISSGITASNWQPNDPRVVNPIEGTYTVTLSNGNCSYNCSFNIELTNPFQDLITNQFLCSNDLPYMSQYIYDSYPYSISVNGVVVFDEYGNYINTSYFNQTQDQLLFTNSGNYQIVLNYYMDDNNSSVECSKTYNLNISNPINFNHMPTNFIICDSSMDICGPNPPIGNIYNYSWFGPTPNGNQSILLSTNPCFIPQTNGSYNLVVTDENGCTGNHTFTVINQLPTVELGHDIIICDGDYHSIPSINISNQGFDSGNFEITWYHNGNVIQNGGTVLQISPISGTISVVVSSPGSGCQTQIDQIEIIEKECCPEEVNIGMILCPGQAPIFHILNQGYNLPDYTITWYFNGNIIQNGGEILQLSLYGNGVLSVTVEKEGCKNIVSDQISISCDKDVPYHEKINNQANDVMNKSLNIYPNPTNDVVNFVFDKNETGKIEIYSLEGKLVFSNDFKEVTNLSANLSDYQDGIYITRITIGNETTIKKIIKE